MPREGISEGGIEVNEDIVSSMMLVLTYAISEKHPETNRGGGLGGEFGYGCDFENEEFKMSPYCWCEKERCPLCSGDAPNFLHKPSGAEVSWYKYVGRGMIVSDGDIPWAEVLRRCLSSLSEEGDSP